MLIDQIKRLSRLVLYSLGLGLCAVGFFMATSAALSQPEAHALTQPSLTGSVFTRGEL